MAWFHDPKLLRAGIAEHGNPTAAARALGGNPRTVRDAWNRMRQGIPLREQNDPMRMGGKVAHGDDGLGPVGKSDETPDGVVLVSSPIRGGTADVEPDDLFRQHGLVPEHYDYNVSMTSWDALIGRDPETGEAGTTRLSRMKIDAVRKPETMFPFEIPLDWVPRRAEPPAFDPGVPWLVPIFSDPHAPQHQVELVEASIAFLEAHRESIRGLFCLGDVADNSPFGRHAPNLRTECTVEDAVWKTTELLIRWKNALPDWVTPELLFGNHDYWLTKRILEVYPKLMRLRRYQEDAPYLAISKILKLDEIGWAYHETLGEYHDVHVELATDLVGIHGTRTGPKGGAVAEFSKWEGVSIMQGHDHTLAMIALRKRLMGGGHVQRYAISAGSMANADLGYDPGHNVGQGFPVLQVWPDGRWHVDFAQYDPVTRSTTWRDWRYDAA